MQITSKVLSNGVSRRIVLLFISIAIIPLLIFTGLTLYKVKDNLVDHHSQQLRQMAKNIGMDIFEVLQYNKDELGLFASILTEGNSKTVKDFLQYRDPNQTYRIDSLFILSPTNTTRVLHGELNLSGNRLLDKINENFVPNKAILLIQPVDNQQANVDVFIFVPMGDYSKSRELLGAKLNMQTLLNIDLLSTQSEAVCILTESGVPIYCNKRQDTKWLSKIVKLAQTSFSSSFVFQGDEEQEMISAYWSIFLKPHYQIEKWNVAIALPYSKQMEAVLTFQGVFLKVVFVTFILVVLLSIFSIRKVLLPLEKLLIGTRQLSQGIFKTRVSIQTKDEFEELGISFNNMAEKLGNHFLQQNLLIEFSSHIQNASTIKSALLVAYEALPKFTRDSHFVLVQIEGHTSFYEMACIYSNNDKLIERSMLNMASSSVLPKMVWRGTLNDASQFLPILAETSLPHSDKIVLYPALHNGQVTAYLVMLQSSTETQEKSALSLLTQFCDILASALSNISLKKQLQYQADHDSLTGLPNRKLIKAETEKAIQLANARQHELAIMILDIDRFKMINDSMGHVIGDDLLRQLANRLRQFTSRRDILSRFAGDEFVFLFTTDHATIRNIIPEIIARLDRVFIDTFKLVNREIHISASKGIAIYPDDGKTFIDLLKNADAAMYQAKRSKPGSHAFFSKSLQDSLSDEMEIEQDLIDALTERQFELYYQPSIDLLNGKMIGAEALLRWHRPGFSLVSPGLFIELAEDTGLIEPIGNWVMKHACEVYLSWCKQGIQLEYISVNVSSVQLKNPTFAETVKHTLQTTGMRPDNLEIEITETAFIKDYQASLQKLHALRDIGIRIAIDDFGTGYASLKHLKQLPADRLKIDRLFIKDLPGNQNDSAIISSLVTLADKLKLGLIAEGIETEEQRDFLIKTGVTIAQGFLMSPPLSSEAFRRFYHDNKQSIGYKGDTLSLPYINGHSN
ncbi:MAG: EAL domain-containing protein [Candidatus Thiodiazotropha sp.]